MSSERNNHWLLSVIIFSLSSRVSIFLQSHRDQSMRRYPRHRQSVSTQNMKRGWSQKESPETVLFQRFPAIKPCKVEAPGHFDKAPPRRHEKLISPRCTLSGNDFPRSKPLTRQCTPARKHHHKSWGVAAHWLRMWLQKGGNPPQPNTGIITIAENDIKWIFDHRQSKVQPLQVWKSGQ